MRERIDAELTRLKSVYKLVDFVPDGRWVRVRHYPMTEGWNRTTADVVFQIPAEYPGNPPYGFYVLSGIRFKEQIPKSYNDKHGTQPPYEGEWGFFSWRIDGTWKPGSSVESGSNLADWARGVQKRLKEGV